MREYGKNTESGRKLREELAKEKERKDKQMKKIKKGSVAGLLFLSVLSLTLGIVSKVSMDDKFNAIAAQYMEEKETYDQLKQKDELGINAQIEYVDPDINNAYNACLAVCNAQNKLSQHVYEALKSGEKNRDVVTKAHGDVLLEYRKYVSTSETAGIKFSHEEWARPMINTLVENNINIDMAACPLQWYCSEPFDYRGNKVRVVWRCYSITDTEQEKLLAIVTATYDSVSNQFSNMEQFITTYGEELE